MSALESYIARELVVAAPEEKVSEVAVRMRSAEVGAALVVENGTLVGIFSERDLLNRVIADGCDAAATPVGEVATTVLHTVSSSSSIKECARKLQEHHVRHLPVVDGEKPVGIISSRDFFSEISARLEDLIERVRYDEQLRENVDPYDHIGGSYGR